MGDSEATVSELSSIEARLKNWFLFRRVQAERSMSIKKLLDEENFLGLGCNNEKVPLKDRILWNDIINGRPKLEDSLSVNAREMKADVYMDMFTRGCNLDNKCRLTGLDFTLVCSHAGSRFFRCLQENFALDSQTRDKKCNDDFLQFDSCRQELKNQQEHAIKIAKQRQDELDQEAKRLFERRKILLKQNNA
ncbi:hypothetical protein BdWA1_000544 [Babesia duncani]|uniref:Uncharacterized protein n=1 Tax=Babesia duncani TaxID=323732 RepID=A0AAD9PMI6_9APIC|nr:hypothetical protein BdWA1_000544 [Babesia duncani]